MRYYKIHLGSKNSLAKIGLEESIIGLDYDMPDLTLLVEDPNIKEKLNPIYVETHPNVTKMQIASGIGAIYRFIKIIEVSDIVLLPLGDGTYRIGEVTGEYYYASNYESIPHRRTVRWYATLTKDIFSESLKNTLGAIGTISEVTHQSKEIENLLSGDDSKINNIITSESDQTEFALEKHLEDFILTNWSKLDLGKEYDLVKNEDGEIIARQYQTEVGPIDILAVKKDGSELLVIELKKGRSGDAVVGQTLRYLTAVKKELAEDGQTVRGLIITGSDDKKIRYSLEPLLGNIGFKVYEVAFSLKNII